MEELDAGWPPLPEDLNLTLPPVGDGLDQAQLLDSRGLPPAIGGPVLSATEVVPDRSLGNAENPRRLGLRLASLLQDLDRHDLLPCELGQGGASERDLGCPRSAWKRLARLSMDVQYDDRTEPLSGS